MSTDFKVKVNNTFSFDLEKESISQLDAVSTEKDKFHILHQNQSYNAEIISSDFNHKQYTVKINTNTYVVTISNKLDMLINGFRTWSNKTSKFHKSPNAWFDSRNFCSCRSDCKGK